MPETSASESASALTVPVTKARYRETARALGALGIALRRAVSDALDQGSTPFLPFVLRVVFISFVPVAVAGVVGWSSGLLTPTIDDVLPRWPGVFDPTWIVVIGLADAWIGSPVVETALLFVPIRLLRLIRLPPAWIPVICGILCGWLHVRRSHWIAWGVGWSFLCMTVVLMRNESPSLDRAWIKVSVIHAIQNVLAVALELGLVALSVG